MRGLVGGDGFSLWWRGRIVDCVVWGESDGCLEGFDGGFDSIGFFFVVGEFLDEIENLFSVCEMCMLEVEVGLKELGGWRGINFFDVYGVELFYWLLYEIRELCRVKGLMKLCKIVGIDDIFNSGELGFFR